MQVGAHVSVAGGVDNAVQRQVDVGGNCGQIFTTSPQVWQDPSISDDEADRFVDCSAESGVGPWVIHSSYLVNLATPKEDLRGKSRSSMQAELDAADRLDIEYVNVHLGAHTGAGIEGGLDNAAEVIDSLEIPDDVTLLIESDAGSGTKLGGEFEHLAGVIDRTDADIEVCLDTAHAFAAGYDLSTPDAVEQSLAEFDDVIGFDDLASVHLNDSKHDCGTNKDEHAHIGEGKIGEDGMRAFINHQAVRDVPLVLETPTENGKSYEWNIDRVRELRD
ncbi:MAG: deoxyribonuclease-4 [Natronomonas sp.]|jgi:deoxyribonuclease-4